MPSSAGRVGERRSTAWLPRASRGCGPAMGVVTLGHDDGCGGVSSGFIQEWIPKLARTSSPETALPNSQPWPSEHPPLQAILGAIVSQCPRR